MTPFMKLLRRSAEKWFGRWEEGPEPPQRLREIVTVFANQHPRATRKDWVDFAAEHAEEAYRQGYVRGFEHLERDPDPFPLRPEELADQMDPDWRWAPDVTLDDGTGIVQGEELPDFELVPEQIARMSKGPMEEPPW